MLTRSINLLKLLGLIMTFWLNPSLASASSDSESGFSINKEYQLFLDQHFSPTTGAHALISLYKTYEALDDWLIPSSENDTSFSTIGARLLKLSFLDRLIASTLMVTQHEFFGHGARLRELGIPNISYTIKPWSGSTYFPGKAYYNLNTASQNAVIYAGVESTYVLASVLRKEMLNKKLMDSRESNLYFTTALDQTIYILGTKHHKDTNMGHDIHNYVNYINEWHGSTVINTQKLRRKTLIDFLDPFLFFSIYNMSHYVLSGETSFEPITINVQDFQYLPALRLGLAPFGTEYNFLNFLKSPEHFYTLALRYGNTGQKKSWGLGFEMDNIWQDENFKVDLGIYLWSQPQFFKDKAILAKNQLGGAFSLLGQYEFTEKFSLMGQLAYKTQGYLLSEPLKSTPIVRLGVKVQL
ncbi:MAG: hypothetical protein JWM09_1342 [Francisellaceae bacterium]|nr:hypothetical protein [Francisellaceae bacterium]